MKIRSFDHALPYFFRQPIHGQGLSDNIPEAAKSASESERTAIAAKDILRWADDGGEIAEHDHSTLDQKRKKPNE